MSPACIPKLLKGGYILLGTSPSSISRALRLENYWKFYKRTNTAHFTKSTSESSRSDAIMRNGTDNGAQFAFNFGILNPVDNIKRIFG